MILWGGETLFRFVKSCEASFDLFCIALASIPSFRQKKEETSCRPHPMTPATLVEGIDSNRIESAACIFLFIPVRHQQGWDRRR